MGVFDTIELTIPCPACGGRLEGQTKSADDPGFDRYAVGDLLPGGRALRFMHVLVSCRGEEAARKGCDAHWDVEWPLDAEGRILPPPPVDAWRRWLP